MATLRSQLRAWKGGGSEEEMMFAEWRLDDLCGSEVFRAKWVGHEHTYH
jgi:hypothetical protein